MPPHLVSWFVCADLSYACVTSLRHLENLQADGRMILKYILENEHVKIWIGFSCLRLVPQMKGFNEHSDGHFVFTKANDFLTDLATNT